MSNLILNIFSLNPCIRCDRLCVEYVFVCLCESVRCACACVCVCVCVSECLCSGEFELRK
jgi:hypothetical protein